MKANTNQVRSMYRLPQLLAIVVIALAGCSSPSASALGEDQTSQASEATLEDCMGGCGERYDECIGDGQNLAPAARIACGNARATCLRACRLSQPSVSTGR
jgi:hypothetical protein